jgi:type IV pilus assembly protein PilM
MRFIDKLISPPQDRYNLIDLNFIAPLFQKTLHREKQVFTFNIDSNYFRILAFNNEEKILFQPIERKYIEEVPFEEKLAEITQYIEELKEKNIAINKLSYGTYLPTQYGLLRLYTFPANLKKKEVLQSLIIYIQQEIAETYKEKNVVYSYAFLDRKKNEPYKVLVTILEKDPLDSLINWAYTLQLDLKLISFEPVCLINLGLLRNLPLPFSILYTDLNKIIVLSFQEERILYEVFPYVFSLEQDMEQSLNMLIWDIRNYIVLNDLTNIFLAGIVVEYEALAQYFLERLPIFGIINLDNFPERYSLLYTLGERIINA